jgi:hypothetical protein
VCLDVFIVRFRVTENKLGEEILIKKSKRQIKRQIRRQVALEISYPLGLLGLFVFGGAFP